jgi:ribosome-associated protein
MVKIRGEHITLGQLLKKEDFIDSGSSAKFFLLKSSVTVNGVEENRRGRKLFAKDVVVINGKKLIIENED